MTFIRNFVLEKLTEVERYHAELKQLMEFSDEEILNDSGKMHIAERLLQLIVDGILDVNQHFIKELDLEAVEDFQSTFYALGKSGVLPPDFAEKIAPVVGLCNRVVHRYETLNTKLLLESLRKNREDFDKYARLIHEYLDRAQK